MGNVLGFVLVVGVAAFIVTQLIVPLSKGEAVLPALKKFEEKDDNNE